LIKKLRINSKGRREFTQSAQRKSVLIHNAEWKRREVGSWKLEAGSWKLEA
jgi:hypothetical protein